MGVRFIEVGEEDEGQRVDNFLMRHYRNVPKTLIYRIIRKGEVRVNKGRVKQNTRIKAGDLVRVPPIKTPDKVEVVLPTKQIQRIEQSILFEDADLMVINKPSGIAVHGGSGIHWGLIELVRSMRPLAKRIELVHRLDRDTSGCIILAKKASVLKALHEQMRENKFDKRYLALLVSEWPKGVEKVDLPLIKNTLKSGERLVKVSADGKPSVSYFRILQRFERATLVTVKLVTGRTHQIRVHALSQNCPLVGDDKYGDKEMNKEYKKLGMKRLALHAQFIGFKHPNTEKWVEIEAPLDGEFTEIIETLKRSAHG